MDERRSAAGRAATAGELAERIPRGRLRELVGDAAVVVTGITHDSRDVTAGALFACIPGERHDGHAFAAAAIEAGAVALLCERRLPLAATQLVVDDARAVLGPLASAFFGDPSRSLTTVGVTGTNGKTTTAHLVAAALGGAPGGTGGTAGGAGVIGTLSGTRTTPEAPELQAQLAAMRDDGLRAAVLEVSSHALALHRVDGTWFDAAVFTNLGRDHLDLHVSMEEYFRAKARLFTPELSALGVVNVDDPYGRLLLDAAAIPTRPYSAADATDVEVSATRHSFTWRGHRVEVALGGAFNVMNSLAALTAASEVGVASADAVAGLAAAGPVPGRFEVVGGAEQTAPIVIVDYAHTPDGIAELLTAARNVAPSGTVTIVFGCGGDRDREKRPQMGAAAVAGADRVVVTSDNPRSEDPMAIIDAVVAGVRKHDRHRLVVEPDRRAAIELAIRSAGVGDVVVVAGKGHESTQTIGTVAHEFDDRAVAREILEDRR